MPSFRFINSNVPKDPQLEIRRGNIAGMVAGNLQGHADGMGTSFQMIWGNTSLFNGRALYDTPATVKVASTDANDTSAGTGTRTILLQGYNSSDAPISETITMNGQTEVTSSNTYKTVTGMVQTTVGSGVKNAGDIWSGNGSFTSGVPATKYLFMEAGDTLSKSAVNFVSAGHSHWVIQVALLIADTGKSLQVHLMTYDGTHERRVVVFELGAGVLSTDTDSVPAITAGQMWWMMGKVSATTADVTTILAYIDETL